MVEEASIIVPMRVAPAGVTASCWRSLRLAREPGRLYVLLGRFEEPSHEESQSARGESSLSMSEAADLMPYGLLASLG